MRRLLNRHPTRLGSVGLAALPFILVLLIYVFASHARLEANPNDKLLPSMTSMAVAWHNAAMVPDTRSGTYLFWVDTASSLKRLSAGLGISAALGLLFGVAIGVIPLLRAALSPIMTAASMVPPLAVLPILFIVFGLGEVSKVVLMVFGIAPFVMRDMALRVAELPVEQIIKAQTLGASTWTLIVRVVLPQMMPRLIDSIRLSLGAAWLFLIAAEAIAATDGLGYRIFLVRRYMAMDIILPYVVWITLLAFLADYALRVVTKALFPWYATQGR